MNQHSIYLFIELRISEPRQYWDVLGNPFDSGSLDKTVLT